MLTKFPQLLNVERISSGYKTTFNPKTNRIAIASRSIHPSVNSLLYNFNEGGYLLSVSEVIVLRFQSDFDFIYVRAVNEIKSLR